jgi:hypothetical protein
LLVYGIKWIIVRIQVAIFWSILQVYRKTGIKMENTRKWGRKYIPILQIHWIYEHNEKHNAADEN